MADTSTTPRPADMSSGTGATAQAQDKAQEVAGQAQEKASEIAGQAKEQAQNVAGQAQTQLRSQVDQRSTQAGEQVTQQASDLRTVSESLREQGKEGPAKVADQAAEKIEKVGSYLTESNSDKILGDVEDLARKQPMAVLAGGLLLGFAASRFLKASQTQRYQQRYSSSPQQLPNTYDRPVGTTTPPVAPPVGGVTTPPLGGTGNELSGGVGAGAPRHTGAPIGTTTDTERTRVGGTGTL